MKIKNQAPPISSKIEKTALSGTNTLDYNYYEYVPIYVNDGNQIYWSFSSTKLVYITVIGMSDADYNAWVGNNRIFSTCGCTYTVLSGSITSGGTTDSDYNYANVHLSKT